MPGSLETPFEGGRADWGRLYLARGEEINPARPILTGDVFRGLPLPGVTGAVKKRDVLVLQHPCSMRKDGVRLKERILVAEVVRRSVLEESQWNGNFALMPLPDLCPEFAGKKSHYVANFDNLQTVDAASLTNRISCLSQHGVNLLLQRWVHYLSRVVVPTFSFHEQASSYYDEADLIEEWCDERGALTDEEIESAQQECVQWLQCENAAGESAQRRLENPQKRSSVRREMRARLKNMK